MKPLQFFTQKKREFRKITLFCNFQNHKNKFDQKTCKITKKIETFVRSTDVNLKFLFFMPMCAIKNKKSSILKSSETAIVFNNSQKNKSEKSGKNNKK